jgi:hypothetical protein
MRQRFLVDLDTTNVSSITICILLYIKNVFNFYRRYQFTSCMAVLPWHAHQKDLIVGQTAFGGLGKSTIFA